MRWLRGIRPSKLKTCPSCGVAHRLEEMDVGYGRPDFYFTLDEHQRVDHWWESSDFAQFAEDRFFIRCVAEIPVRNTRRRFGYGVWVEVTREKYYRYADIFTDPLQSTEPGFDGTIANELRVYEPPTLGLPVTIKLRSGGTRPSVSVKDATHPLAIEQDRGVTVDRVLEIHHSD